MSDRHGPINLPCVVCGKALKNLMEGKGSQPVGGLAFTTHGHFGSTIFDPMDGSALEIVVCDECVTKGQQGGFVASYGPLGARMTGAA